MVIAYRTLSHVGQASMLRRLLFHLLCCLRVVEQKLKVKKMLLLLLMFLATLAISPWLFLMFAALQIGRACLRTFLSYRYPDWHFVNVSSLRCALDTVRCPGMITVFVMLDGYMDLAELQKCVKTFVQSQEEIYPILRQCITSKFSCYMWKDSNDFDIVDHVVTSRGIRRNKSVTDVVLQNHISELCSRPLSNKRPPWEMVLVPLPKCGSISNCGILFRMHHLIAEQLPMKTVLLPTCMNLWNRDEKVPLLGNHSATRRLFSNFFQSLSSCWQSLKNKCNPSKIKDDDDDMLTKFWTAVRSFVWVVQRVLTESQKLYDVAEIQAFGKNLFSYILCFYYFFPSAVKKFELRVAGSLYYGARKVFVVFLLFPFFALVLMWQLITGFFRQIRMLYAYLHHQLYKDTYGKELVVTAAKEVLSAMMAAFIAPGVGLHELTRNVEPVPLLQWRAWSGHRVYAWTPPASVQLIRNICEATDTTPSEVLLASCTGILRHYFRTLGNDVPENVSATIPLCTDTTADPKQIQGFAVVALPTGEADPITRLKTIQQRMHEIRDMPQKYVLSVYLLRFATSFLPQPLLTMILNFFSHKYPVTITDVFISDSIPVSIGKNSIHTFNYWRPAQGNIGLSLTFIHYSHGVSLAIASDREVLPQPSVMTSQLLKELHDMAMMLGLRFEKEPPRSPFGSPLLRSDCSSCGSIINESFQ